MSDATADRLTELQGELKELLSERIRELNELVTDSEATTRRLLLAEIELERHRAAKTSLDASMKEIEGDVAEARAAAEEARTSYGDLLGERDSLRLELAKLREQNESARRQVEEGRRQREQLDEEATALKKENDVLENKLRSLEANVMRMRKLREELMYSMAGLTEEMKGVAGGVKE